MRFRTRRRGRLLSQDLSWYRITSRDLVIPATWRSRRPRKRPRRAADRADAVADAADAAAGESDLHQFPAVADWRDTASLPRLSRDLLEEASGITIPSSHFVLRVILAYLLAVVPLNWLICRFVLNKREWAWIVVPLVALGFAIGVERVAAHDMGYDTAADEIDLLELHGDYHRAHLTRLVSLYTTGRSHFAVSYPERPDGARPAARQRAIDSRRGHRELGVAIVSGAGAFEFHGSAAQPGDVPRRGDADLGRRHPADGSTAGKREIVNESGLELRDAVLIESTGPGKQQERLLGTIKPGASVEIEAQAGQASCRAGRRRAGAGRESVPGGAADVAGKTARKTRASCAWSPGSRARVAGQSIEPADRSQARVHRGARPPAQRPATQPRRQALQPAGCGKRQRTARLRSNERSSRAARRRPSSTMGRRRVPPPARKTCSGPAADELTDSRDEQAAGDC